MQNAQKSVFVAMPFRKEDEPVFASIKEACARLNLVVRRVDEEPFVGSIVAYILEAVSSSDFMAAVLTVENGNVYYEIGLAHCRKKPVVLLTANPGSLKFDLRDHRALIYDPEKPQALIDPLTKTLASLMVTSDDPETRLAKAYGIEDGGHARELAVDKAIEKLTEIARLSKPVKVLTVQALKGSEDTLIEVEDFHESRVRAVVDVNGLLRDIHRKND
jgi:hypothetical protein